MSAARKPNVFIASSVEGLRIADAINANLEHDAHCTVWRAGTFKLSSQTVDDLVKKSSAIDFAVFVFTPDDIATIRNRERAIARDNVVFEIGLFVGSIGKDRCYIVKPRDIEMHLPSDLLGIMPADYATDRPDGDIESALNYACKLIKDRVSEIGVICRKAPKGTSDNFRHILSPPDYNLEDADLMFLAVCVKNQMSNPSGYSFDEVIRELRGYGDYMLTISALKLERLGYVAKSIQRDYNNQYDYYSFAATEDGHDAVLKHAARISSIRHSNTSKKHDTARKASKGFDDMNDDIPF